MFKQGSSFFFPNGEPVPLSSQETARDQVKKFSGNHKSPKVEEPQKKEEPSNIAAFMEIGNWETWAPPEVNMKESQVQWGMRKSQRLAEKSQGKSKPVNQVPPEPENEPSAPVKEVGSRKRRPSYPGAWIEEVDQDSEDKEEEPSEEPLKRPENEPWRSSFLLHQSFFSF